MSLNPPTIWKLYRNHVKLGASTYAIPKRWCVLVHRADAEVRGPQREDRLTLASAIEVGVLQYVYEAEVQAAGHVQCGWFWNDDKGLLTDEERAGGEDGTGTVIL